MGRALTSRTSQALAAAGLLALGLTHAREAVGQTCTTASDCPLPGAPCELCTNGKTVCPVVNCVSGQCQYEFPSCTGDCAPGLDWCPLNGHCTSPACLACCQFGTSCAAAADCGQACVTCPDGTSSCAAGQCGTELKGQCFYPQPVCSAPQPVPAWPTWSLIVAAGAVALLGAAARARLTSSRT
jgi:hypothetical protein